MKFAEADYLQFNPYEGDEGTVNCRTVRLIRARKERPCFMGAGHYGDKHIIRPGDMYRSERALVDGDYWGNYAVCVPCMDKWLIDIGQQPNLTESDHRKE